MICSLLFPATVYIRAGPLLGQRPRQPATTQEVRPLCGLMETRAFCFQRHYDLMAELMNRAHVILRICVGVIQVLPAFFYLVCFFGFFLLNRNQKVLVIMWHF